MVDPKYVVGVEDTPTQFLPPSADCAAKSINVSQKFPVIDSGGKKIDCEFRGDNRGLGAMRTLYSLPPTPSEIFFFLRKCPFQRNKK